MVFEAKRPNGLKAGLNEKDDPRRGLYLTYPSMGDIHRKKQFLLIDQRDVGRLPEDLRDDPSVLTWQELLQLQRAAICRSASSASAELWHGLTRHYSLLGFDLYGVHEDDALHSDSNLPDALVERWFRGLRSYEAHRTGIATPPPFDWMNQELPRSQQRLGQSELGQVLWKLDQ